MGEGGCKIRKEDDEDLQPIFRHPEITSFRWCPRSTSVRDVTLLIFIWRSFSMEQKYLRLSNEARNRAYVAEEVTSLSFAVLAVEEK